MLEQFIKAVNVRLLLITAQFLVVFKVHNIKSSYADSIMELFGIQFAPLNIPLERRLQTLSAATITFVFIFGGPVCALLTFYLLFYTKLWWLIVLYMCWFYWDRNTPEQGGRRFRWVNGWSFWKYLKDYYPIGMKKVDELELDVKKNYLFVHFPHGYIGSGAFAAFISKFSGFRKLFPNHTRYVATLNLNFSFPFYREFMLSIRGISVSAKSLNYVLSSAEGSKIALILPGGASEAFYSAPGCYDLVLKNRKGFIKLAMKNGTSVVPSIGFGETDLLTVIDVTQIPIFSTLAVQVKKIFGFVLLVANGRGFFQYNYGMIPRRKPVNVLFGPEFKVEKNPNPNDAEVSEVHARFLEHLYKFFEENKHNYLKNVENVHLVYK